MKYYIFSAILLGMKIKAIISDLGRVFVDFDHSISCIKVAKLAGCKPEEVYEYIYQNKMDIKLDRGEIAPEVFYRRVKKHFKLKLSYGEFVTIFSDIFTLIVPVVELYKKLKKRYKLVFLSNTNILHFETSLNNLSLSNVFEGGVLSYKEGLMKPHPRLYLKAVKLTGFKPEECVYIDDVSEFVDAARLLGLRGIQYRNIKQLKRELKKLGVL
ncbi:MAG: HAD family phosphatase [Candidatus Firestonebacteria bacterium]